MSVVFVDANSKHDSLCSAGGYRGYPQLPYRGEYPYSYPAYPGPYPYNGYPSNFVYKNRVGLDIGDGNRDGVYETYEDNDHALRDYTAREQYRQWEDAQERGEYDDFLRRNYFSDPADTVQGAILREERDGVGGSAQADVGGSEDDEPSTDGRARQDQDSEEAGNTGVEASVDAAGEEEEGSGDRQLEEEDGERLWNARGNQ